MRAIIVNNHGEAEVDPFNTKGMYDQWVASITKDGKVDYASLSHLSAQHSEQVTRYILDLAAGKNTAKGHRKGPRSYTHLTHLRFHLSSTLRLLENHTKKYEMNFTEDDVLLVFQGMRNGTIHNRKGTPFLDVSTYAKIFCAFWRWHTRVQRKEGVTIPDIVETLDTMPDKKPAWHYFTLKDVEHMAELAPYFEYKALVYFLFDTGIRAPKELMNVRVKDITPIPNTTQAFVNIREETSKTFGRKIKLMLSSEFLKKLMIEKKLQPNDFLFTNSPVVYNRVLAKLGYKVLGIGIPRQQRKSNGKVHKTLVKQGITMYDFRHNSVCHYLPIYKSENQMKYRYGWKKSDMIHYYTEFLGMKDTITDDDMLVDTTKTQLEQALQKEQQKVAILEERMNAKETEMENRLKNMEAMLLQKFADHFTP